jgi:hypothetical protein
MSVATATPEQLARLYNFIALLRSTTIRIWQQSNATDTIIQAWNSDILAIIGTPQGTVIHDNTGLAGAVPLTDTQVTNLFSILQNLQSTTMTAGNKDLFMLATGPNNALSV